jgi:hypothetical protein
MGRRGMHTGYCWNARGEKPLLGIPRRKWVKIFKNYLGGIVLEV